MEIHTVVYVLHNARSVYRDNTAHVYVFREPVRPEIVVYVYDRITDEKYRIEFKDKDEYYDTVEKFKFSGMMDLIEMELL